MYHYDPSTALEELKEDGILPNPVHVRDMMIRAHLRPEQALEANRKFQDYLHGFGEMQVQAQAILKLLSEASS